MRILRQISKKNRRRTNVIFSIIKVNVFSAEVEACILHVAEGCSEVRLKIKVEPDEDGERQASEL